MPATCPVCSWPTPTTVSTHGNIRYLRCICGKWLIQDRDEVLATAGASTFTDSYETPAPR